MINEKRWTKQSLIEMPTNEFRVFSLMVAARCWAMLGINFEIFCEASFDPMTGDLVIRYK